jgi:UDP-N-acetylmuramoyl-tripeptide--D-alanyl-D-alanine ligase
MMTLREAGTAMGAAEVDPTGRFERVTTDTRSLLPRDLFFALRGERVDGHQFVKTAFDLAASGAVVEKSFRLGGAADAMLIRVDDTRLALGRLAAHWRGRFPIPVAALTGSNGKTTVKEMLAAVLREACREAGMESGSGAAVLATEGNLNNDIGVPLTLLRLRQFHHYAVIEIGMNHAGEIRYLTHLAKPAVALVNNVQRAHLAMLGSIDAVARAKAEVFEGLGPGGTAILNADDAAAGLLRRAASGRRCLAFGIQHTADIRASYKLAVFDSAIDFTTPRGRFSVTLPVPGMHNVRNAAAACATALALDIPPSAIVAGLNGFRGVPGRLQFKPGLRGARLIDDTYNANPDSVVAAIHVLRGRTGRTILVLGDMGEIGPAGPELHRQIGAYAKRAGVDQCLTLGELSMHAARAFGEGARHFERVEELVAQLKPRLDETVTVLVKGSRFMHMERVIEELGS